MTAPTSRHPTRTPKQNIQPMRGYFGIGVEGISKSFNVGNLFRSAHAFGANFVFTVAAAYRRRQGKRTDTSDATSNLPFYAFPDVPQMQLPTNCKLVGVEFLEDAVDLPSFHHPRQAAYVMGPELSSLSPEMLARCDHVIKIPTRICLNVGIAGVLVMYDRLIAHGNFADRPMMEGGPGTTPPEMYRAEPPLGDVAFATQGGGRKYSDKG